MTQGKVDLISYFWSQVTLFISNRVRDGVKPSRLNETVPMQNRAQGSDRQDRVVRPSNPYLAAPGRRMELTSCPTQKITKAPGGTSSTTPQPALVLLQQVRPFGRWSIR